MAFKRFESTLGSGNIIRQMLVNDDGTVRYTFSVMVNQNQSVGINIENLSGDDLRALAHNIDKLREMGNLPAPKIFQAEIEN